MKTVTAGFRHVGWPLASLLAVLGAYGRLSAEPTEPASVASAGTDTEVLATFDSGRITRQDFEAVLAFKSPRELERIAQPGGREALLESMIRYDLLVREAERRGYADRVAVEVAQEQRASELMVAAAVAVDRAAITPAEVHRAYAERKHQFGRPQLRRATHIRVDSEAEAKALAARLQGAGREQFAQVAREKNTDPRTRNQGGELGYFDREGKTESGRPTEVPPELVAAAWELRRVGDVTRQPVAHGGAYSVLMLTGDMPAIEKSRAELEPVLREQLATEREKAAVEALVRELRAKYPIEVHPELVDAIVLPPAVPLDIPEGFAAAPRDPRAPPIRVEPDGI